MKKYQLQPAAEQDLEGIWLYSVNRWGVPQADAYIDDLDECFHLLAEEPQLAPVRREFTPRVRIHSSLHPTRDGRWGICRLPFPVPVTCDRDARY